MMNAKTGNWFTDNPQRGRSNNSAVIVRDECTKEEFKELMQSIKEFGEPGFYFVEDKDFTTNPCVEIGMYPQINGESGWQGCNLTEINGGKCTTKEEFFKACRAGSIMGTLQAGYTDFKYLDENTKAIFEREALLGVSITGWMNNPDILLDKEIQIEGAEIVKQVKIPVTVKTRLGWDENNIKIMEVAERLQDVGIKALSIHGRTRKQMYKGMANWDYIAEVKNNPKINIPIFGNGDIDSPEKAVEYKKKYGVDGIMIGRAAIGNPWIFDEIKYYLKHNKKKSPPSIDERILAVKKHLDFSIKWKGEKLGLVEMRRHYNNYFKGIDNFKEFRMKLVLSENISSSLETLEEISSIYNTKKETSIT